MSFDVIDIVGRTYTGRGCLCLYDLQINDSVPLPFVSNFRRPPKRLPL